MIGIPTIHITEHRAIDHVICLALLSAELPAWVLLGHGEVQRAAEGEDVRSDLRACLCICVCMYVCM